MLEMSLGCNRLDLFCYQNGKESFIERYGVPLLLEFPSFPSQLNKYRPWSLFSSEIKSFELFQFSYDFHTERNFLGG